MRKRRDDPVLTAFGTRLRECRLARGWSLENLAHECGLNWSYIGPLERGQGNPTLLSLTRLADALGVPVSRLVSDE